jgi:hypothetical protein
VYSVSDNISLETVSDSNTTKKMELVPVITASASILRCCFSYRPEAVALALSNGTIEIWQRGIDKTSQFERFSEATIRIEELNIKKVVDMSFEYFPEFLPDKLNILDDAGKIHVVEFRSRGSYMPGHPFAYSHSLILSLSFIRFFSSGWSDWR